MNASRWWGGGLSHRRQDHPLPQVRVRGPPPRSLGDRLAAAPEPLSPAGVARALWAVRRAALVHPTLMGALAWRLRTSDALDAFGVGDLCAGARARGIGEGEGDVFEYTKPRSTPTNRGRRFLRPTARGVSL